MEFRSKSGVTLLKDKEIREPVYVKDCKDCIIENVSFRYDRTDTTLLTLSNCQRVKVINCKFSDKSTKGLFLKLVGANTKDNEITGCEFWNHTFSQDNGGEPLRIGNSDVSGCVFATKVTKCLFHDLRSDVETISIKSCGNIIDDNEFSNNESMVTVRHGGYNKIINNRFVGKGGIRVLGSGNEIKNNYFKNNQDSRWYPIRIEYGNTERDPNFTSDNKPSGKAGKSHAMYAQVRDGFVAENKFENCKITIQTDKRNRPLGPVNNVSAKNDVVQPGNAIPESEEDPPEPQDPEEDKPITGDETELPEQPTIADYVAKLKETRDKITKIQAMIDFILAKIESQTPAQ